MSSIIDNMMSQMCEDFCQSNCEILRDHEIRRVTFIVLRSKEFPKYFTFRARMNYKEDLVYRHLEPALAFQLELNRLKNYDLHPVPVSNHKVRILCFKFSLTRKCDTKITKDKKLSNLKNSNFDKLPSTEW